MKFIFHIGPPKTGTSAIQYWCETHRDVLQKYGIYYPAHDVDANGISPGNLQSLYSIGEENNDLILSKAKLEKLIIEAEDLGANTVLLSSEFFFKRVNELVELVPNAKFIAYIRFELELLESNYNQAVKRHKRVNTFKVPKVPRAESINFLTNHIKLFGRQRFILRPYSHSVFKDNNIVSDFLANITSRNNGLPVIDSRKINSRYSAEGLELKRWLNKYELGTLQERLDLFLQAQGDNSPPYSFINRDTFKWLKAGYIEELESFFEQYRVPDSENLIRECKEINQKPIRIQYIDMQKFSSLIKNFIAERKENAQLMRTFYSENHKAAESCLDNARMQLIFTHLPLELKMQVNLAKDGAKVTSFVGDVIRNAFDRKINLAIEAGNKVQKRWLKPTARDVYPSVEVVSHHIPKTTGREFALALSKVYRGTDIFNVYSASEAKALKNGQSIWLPSNTRILHGHFPFHENQLNVFPNAVHICWVRDPIERLWLHLNHILNFQQPHHLYCEILALAKQSGLATIEGIFDELINKEQFFSMKNIQQAFITPSGVKNFAFIGSIHRFSSELKRLGNILDKKFPGNSEDCAPVIVGNTVNYERNKVTIGEEYKFIANYL